jgi:chromosome segregation ATPase
MRKEMLVRLARRAIVLAATIAVIAVAAGTVQVAAQWRAAEAPLDAAPVSMGTLQDQFAAEDQRAGDLAGQVDGVATQISTLQSALVAANGSVADDTQSATDLQAQLAAAKTKLAGLQKQLKAAQARLGELNRAAARQAALNRSGGGGGGAAAATPARQTPEPHETEEPEH